MKVNRSDILKKIQEASQRKGANRQDVTLIAVSKMQSLEAMRDLWNQGQRDFAENYVQEFKEKRRALADLEIHWHFIGTLQSNKLKDVVGLCDCIHSVDSFDLAQKISNRAKLLNIQQKILIQVNVAVETNKSGFLQGDLLGRWNDLTSLPNISIVGLMTMPPAVEEAARNREFFQRLRKLLEGLRQTLPAEMRPNFWRLSMGTTQDFEIAIEEGATEIRIGSLLFGPRALK